MNEVRSGRVTVGKSATLLGAILGGILAGYYQNFIPHPEDPKASPTMLEYRLSQLEDHYKEIERKLDQIRDRLPVRSRDSYGVDKKDRAPSIEVERNHQEGG